MWLKSVLKNWVARRRADAELDEEVRGYVEMAADERVRNGVDARAAQREAMMEAGGVEQVKEQTREIRAGHLLETLWQDVRYGARMLRKSPGFTAVAVLTLALGVGATTAIYSVIDATLLHALPYPHPGELVRIEDDLPGVGAQDVSISIPEWKDLENSGIFQYVALEYFNSVNLTGSAQPTRIAMKGVTPNYFAMLGVGAQLGRTFDPGDRTPGLNLEVVISDGLWKGAFGADPRILERTLRLDNDVYHVVGVMPPGFRDQGTTSEERNTELWAAGGFAAVPFPPPLRNSRFGTAFARLKLGLPMASAQAHIDALVASLKKQYPADYPAQAAWNIRLIPLAETL